MLGKLNRGLRHLVKKAIAYTPVPKETVILLGTGRSGTTWIADCINYKNEYRSLFEPFHFRKVKLLAGAPERVFWERDEEDTPLHKKYRKILRGAVMSPWVDRGNKKWATRKLLIKTIKLHFLIDWLFGNYPRVKLVYLMRHPFAVAYSKMTLSKPWVYSLDQYLENQALLRKHLKPFERIIGGDHSEFGGHVVEWCIENRVALRQLHGKDACIVTYEDMCTNPEAEIGRVFSYLDKDYDEGIFKTMKKPSRTTWRQEAAINEGGSLVEGWKDTLTDEQITEGLKILKGFGLDHIYYEGAMPGEVSPIE